MNWACGRRKIRADIREFACAMEAWGVDGAPLLEWAIKGPDRLPELIDQLAAEPLRRVLHPPRHEAGLRGAPGGRRPSSFTFLNIAGV